MVDPTTALCLTSNFPEPLKGWKPFAYHQGSTFSSQDTLQCFKSSLLTYTRTRNSVRSKNSPAMYLPLSPALLQRAGMYLQEFCKHALHTCMCPHAYTQFCFSWHKVGSYFRVSNILFLSFFSGLGEFTCRLMEHHHMVFVTCIVLPCLCPDVRTLT